MVRYLNINIQIVVSLPFDTLHLNISINYLPAKLIYLISHPREVVFRYRGPQQQVGGNCSHLFHLRPKMCKY